VKLTCLKRALTVTLHVAWLGLLSSPALAVAPQWWADQGVLVSGATPNDYAMVNAGQLKNIAKQSYAAMRAHLPSSVWTTPSGTALTAFVGNLSSANNYAPVNVGQLKNIAKPFYDVLISLNAVTAYPWSGSGTAPNDYALANIGQVKNLFRFDLSGSGGVSSPSADLITSTVTATAAVGIPFQYAITATGVPTAFSAGGLPAGLTLDGTSGLITGSPTTAGVYTVALGATTSSGGAAGVLVISVGTSATSPTISSSLTATATAGASFIYAITATTGPTGYSAASLPAGLSVNASTGIIGGIVATPGT
jgi:hypothetical protein